MRLAFDCDAFAVKYPLPRRLGSGFWLHSTKLTARQSTVHADFSFREQAKHFGLGFRRHPDVDASSQSKASASNGVLLRQPCHKWTSETSMHSRLCSFVKSIGSFQSCLSTQWHTVAYSGLQHVESTWTSGICIPLQSLRCHGPGWCSTLRHWMLGSGKIIHPSMLCHVCSSSTLCKPSRGGVC